MKKFLLPVFAVSALLLSSCSTQQLARQAQSDDDVYYTEAKAKVIEARVATTTETPREKTYRTDEQLYRDNDNIASDRYYDDYSYSTRLNRFYYNSPFRPYYDYRYSYGYNPWYTYSYDPFFYDPWFYRPGVSVWIGNYGSRYYNYNYYGHYGSRYNNGFWGPYSYYNMYPGYGYGYNNGRYYGNNGRFDNPSPGRARPNREGGIGRADNSLDNSGGGSSIPVTGRPSRGSYIPNQDKQSPGRISADPAGSTPPQSGSRPERAREERPSRDGGTSSSSTPAKTQQDQGNARPARPERTYTPPPSYDTPSRGSYGGSSGSSSSGRSSSGSSDSGSSGSSSGGGRPSRGGR